MKRSLLELHHLNALVQDLELCLSNLGDIEQIRTTLELDLMILRKVRDRVEKEGNEVKK